MIGGGVFNLPSDMSKAASPGAVLVGWLVTGIGMLMLAFVYQGLATRQPDLNAGAGVSRSNVTAEVLPHLMGRNSLCGKEPDFNLEKVKPNDDARQHRRIEGVRPQGS
jgi:hypothetical protein